MTTAPRRVFGCPQIRPRSRLSRASERRLRRPRSGADRRGARLRYDPLNRVICTAERENASAFTSLPAACVQSASTQTSPDQITQFTYDLAGQKLIETRGFATALQQAYATYTYSQDGNLATVLDANNNLTTNIYDGLNRLSKVEYPLPTLGAGASDPTDAESYSYDANGNRLTLTKRDESTVISFSYDVLNRMATKTFASPNTAADVSYGYDLAGRPLNALFFNVSGTPGVTWTYDAAGRRLTEATNGRSLGFTYDAASNPATMTWPDGVVLTYAFDAANRLTSVGNTGVATVAPGYDGLSRMTSINRGSSSSAMGYDSADRLTSLAHAFSPTTGSQTWGFTYTPGGQIASSTSTNAAYDWTVGSASVATTANGLNQNATVGGVAQTYDHFGNLTSDGVRTFTYDTENRLLTETGPITMTLSYDPMGRLQQSVINGTTTQFLYDGDALVGEYPATGNTPLRRYVHGEGTDVPLIWYEGGAVSTSTANFLIADRQGTIAAVANTSGAVTANYTYDPYGAPNAWGTVGTVPRFRYTGQAAIPEAQLYYYKARVYDPVAGRFLQTDPVGYGPDVNWYVYVGNDPVNGADPGGNVPQRCLTGACSGGSDYVDLASAGAIDVTDGVTYANAEALFGPPKPDSGSAGVASGSPEVPSAEPPTHSGGSFTEVSNPANGSITSKFISMGEIDEEQTIRFRGGRFSLIQVTAAGIFPLGQGFKITADIYAISDNGSVVPDVRAIDHHDVVVSAFVSSSMSAITHPYSYLIDAKRFGTSESGSYYWVFHRSTFHQFGTEGDAASDVVVKIMGTKP